MAFGRKDRRQTSSDGHLTVQRMSLTTASHGEFPSVVMRPLHARRQCRAAIVILHYSDSDAAANGVAHQRALS